MTNNPTIDGVSLDLYQAAINALQDEGRWDIADRLELALNAPVFERQPDLVECDACPTSGGCVRTCMKAEHAPPAVGEVQVLATVTEGGDLIRNGVLRAVELVDRKHVARLQTELAALQSTIAQLQARVQELESGMGEPVAWAGLNSLGGLMHCMNKEGYLSVSQKPRRYHDIALFTAPPAPVAIELLRKAKGSVSYLSLRGDDIGDENHALLQDIDACLDPTAALNEDRK